MSSRTASGTQAVDRAALLVATVVRADEPMTFAALAEECELPKSTASRLLTALERHELLERTEVGSYVAGPLFGLYATRHDPWAELARLARPMLAAIGEETGETVNLGVPRGGQVAHVAQVDSRYLLGTRDWTDVDVPSHASALGKVLYAHDLLPRPAAPLERLTPATLTRVRDLDHQLAQVRERGYATTVDELEVGLTAIAVPVLGHQGAVIAALGISGPTQRLEDQLAEMAVLLGDQARNVTRLLSRSEHHKTTTEGAA